MNERLASELELLRTAFPDVEFREEDLWACIPSYAIPPDVWGRATCEVAFRFVLPGQPPYGFWVRPGLSLVGGAAIQNYTYPVATAYGDGWGQFSWGAEEWLPGADVRRGANMLRWAQSIAVRLAEGA
jgi:hypothetical protein